MTQTLIRLLADGLIIPIVLFAGYALFFWIPKSQRFGAYKRIFMAGITTYLLAKLMGAVYQPSMERPFELLGIAPGASYLPNPGFPSDHALFAMFLTLAVWFETRRRAAGVALLVLTLLMCIGRILALVHTPLDIAGGLAAAAAGALWYLQGSKESRFSRKNPV